MSLLNKIKKDLQRLKKSFRTRDIDNFIRDLEIFIEQPSEEETQKALKVFLDERWQDIAGGSLSYTCRPHHPVTKLCHAIAKYLQPSFPERCVYQILMPSIKNTYNVFTQAYDLDSYALYQLILSENRKHLIPADLIFSLSFEMSGLHELTSVYVEHEDELPAPLTPEEQKAIIHHNDTSRRLYQKFEELKKLPTGTNLGTELRNLGHSLVEGGRQREYATRHETYQQVRDFFCLFNALSESDRNAWSQLRIRSDDSYTLGEILRAMNGEMVGTTCAVTNGNNILRCIEYNAQFFNRYFEQSNPIKARYNEYLLPIATQRPSGQDTAKHYCPYVAQTHIQEYGYLNWLSALRMMLIAGMAEHEILEEIEYLLKLERSQSFLREYIDPEKLVNLMLEKGYVQLLDCCLNMNSLAFSGFRTIDLFPKLNQAFIQALKDKAVRSIRSFLKYFKDELFSKPNSQLISAIIKANRLDLLEIILNKGLHPHHKLPNGDSLFGMAIRQGSLQALELMIRSLESIEEDCAKNSEIYTRYLHALVQAKHTRFIYWFLDNIPDFEFDLKVDNKNVIQLAIKKGEPEVIRKLVDKATAQENLSNSVKALSFAIWYFAKKDDFLMAERCLNPGLLFDIIGLPKGYTAIHYAVLNNNHLLLDALLKCPNANPDIVFPGSISAEELALDMGRTDMFLKFLAFDALHPQKVKGPMPAKFLHKAIETNNLIIVKALLETPIDLAKKINGQTAIECAIEHNNNAVLIELLEALETLFPSSSWEDYGLGAALCYFAEREETDFALKCIKTYTHMFYSDRKGYTALHYAIEQENEVLLDALLHHNAANPNINFNLVKPELSESIALALHGTCGRNNVIDVESLQAPTGTMSAAHFAMERRNYPAFQRIMAYHEQGGKLNLVPMIYTDYLKKAIELGDQVFFTELVNHPYTALSLENMRLAINKGYSGMVLKLVQMVNECHLNHSTLLGEALLYAVSNNDKALALQCLFLNPNVTLNPNVEIYKTENPHKGYTALHFAIENRDHELLELLLQQTQRDPHQRYLNAMSASELAIALNDDKAIEQILAFDKKKVANYKEAYTQYLHHAIEQKNLTIVKTLLKRHAIDLAHKFRGQNAIECAITNNNCDALIELVEELDTIHSKPYGDDYGLGAALCYFLRRNEKEQALKCLKPYISLCYVSHEGYTPLHYAIERHDVALLDALLQFDVAHPHLNLNLHTEQIIPYERNVLATAEDFQGLFTKTSAALFAMERRNYLAFKHIMAYHVQGPLQNVPEIFAGYLKNAIILCDEVLFTELVNHPYTALNLEIMKLAIKKDLTEMVLKLVQTVRERHDLNYSDFLGEALLYAVSNNDKELAMECLSLNPNVELYKTENPHKGYTALHFAIKNKDYATLSLLLQQQKLSAIEPHARWENAKSAFELAISLKDTKAIEQMMKSDQKNVGFRIKKLEDCYTKYFHQAYRNGDLEILKVLLDSNFVDMNKHINGRNAQQILHDGPVRSFLQPPQSPIRFFTSEVTLPGAVEKIVSPEGENRYYM